MWSWFSSCLEGQGSLLVGKHRRAVLEAAVAFDAVRLGQSCKASELSADWMVSASSRLSKCQAHRGLGEHAKHNRLAQRSTHVALKVLPHSALSGLGTLWRQTCSPQNPLPLAQSIPEEWRNSHTTEWYSQGLCVPRTVCSPRARGSWVRLQGCQGAWNMRQRNVEGGFQSVYWGGRLKVPFPSENWQLLGVWRLVRVFPCCVTKHRRFSSLEHPFIIAQWGYSPGSVAGSSAQGFTSWKQGMGRAVFPSGAESSSVLPDYWQNSVSVAEGLKSLLSCWLPARRCPQVLKALTKIYST